MNRHYASYRQLFSSPQLVRGLFQGIVQAPWVGLLVLLPRALPDVDLPHVDDLLEIKGMLTENSRSWTHQWKMQGHQEGRQEGRQEGEVIILQRQLVRKFGPLNEETLNFLKNASEAQLETWSLNILDADCLDDVFRS